MKESTQEALNYIFSLSSGDELDALLLINDLLYMCIQKAVPVENCLEYEINVYLKDRSASTVRIAETDILSVMLRKVNTLFAEQQDSVVNALLERLKTFEGRQFAAMMLGWFGSKAKPAIPKLVDLASFLNAATGEAQRAIMCIDGAEEEVIRQLRESLTYADDSTFRNLSLLATRMGCAHQPDYSSIIHQAAAAENFEMREAALKAITYVDINQRKPFQNIMLQLANDDYLDIKELANSLLQEARGDCSE